MGGPARLLLFPAVTQDSVHMLTPGTNVLRTRKPTACLPNHVYTLPSLDLRAFWDLNDEIIMIPPTRDVFQETVNCQDSAEREKRIMSSGKET